MTASSDITTSEKSLNKHKILVSDKLGKTGLEVLESTENVIVDVKTGMSEAELVDVISEYDALIVRSGTTVTAEVLQAAKKLKVVGRAGVGVDNVDVAQATRQGVIVMNTPDSNTIATAELAFGLMLASARNIGAAHMSMAEHKWDRSSFTGVEVNSKTLGVVGFGRIGRAVASRAKAFGMTVLAYDPFVAEADAREMEVELVELDELLAASDFVTLHTGLNAETKNLINSERIAIMKNSAVIINAARGGLLDADAVADALDSDQLAGAAIDVYDSEPPADGHRLVGHPKVLHTPHLGASTVEAQNGVAIDIARQVVDALDEVRVVNSVNSAFPSTVDFERVDQFMSLATKIGQLQVAMLDDKIEAVELELHAEDSAELMKPVAAGILKGILSELPKDAGASDIEMNSINAPMFAAEKGLEISRSVGLGQGDYLNQITCRIKWDGGERTVSGVVFSDNHPRIVQISNYRFEASPQGVVLLMLNDDVPGVIGTVGQVLGQHEINVAEYRLGRNEERTKALSFINLDSVPGSEVLQALADLEAVTKAVVVEL